MLDYNKVTVIKSCNSTNMIFLTMKKQLLHLSVLFLLFFLKQTIFSQIKNEFTTYTNPVLDTNFPDPAIVRAADGYFYSYATQGHSAHIQVVKSKDLINWIHQGDAMPVKPKWATNTHNFWAPDVNFHNGKYYMYFSSDQNEKKGKCIGIALSDYPSGPFIATDTPMVCGSGFINIDPMAFDDPVTGKKLLYWGSGFKAIKVQELDDDRIHFKKGSSPIDLLDTINKPDNYQQLVEGVWVAKHGEYYYMYYSGNNCCDPNPHYAVMVARSKSATGPFETLANEQKKEQSTILIQNDHWLAPGHNSIITDDAGQDWILYHAMSAANSHSSGANGKKYVRRVMLIDKIIYKNNWPVLENDSPSYAPKSKPIIN